MSKTIAIIGGGVVGLNIALELSKRKAGDVFLLEKEPFFGHHTSTRNSEVVHAGLAYPEDSLKTKLCLTGNRLTYKLLDELRVPYKRDGKWIVAYTDDEVQAIERMLLHTSSVGTPGMRHASPGEVSALSALIKKPKSAAYSETTGIMDASSYIEALGRALFQRDGVFTIYPCEVTSIDVSRGKLDTKERGDMDFDIVINAAGLFADDIYRMCGGKRNFEIKPFKGEYYTWRRDGFDGLVYPVPKSFLPKADPTETSNFGIHMHRTVAGELLLGPSQLEVKDKTDYTIETTPEVFADSIAELLNEMPDVKDMMPGFAGNRPKLFENGQAMKDFEIFREGDTIHLLGIESPGLTAAPAIAKYIIQFF